MKEENIMNKKEQLLLNKINANKEQNMWLKDHYYQFFQLAQDMKDIVKEHKEWKKYIETTIQDLKKEIRK